MCPSGQHGSMKLDILPLLINQDRVRSLQGNLRSRPVQSLGLSFPCNDQTDEVNKLFIVWSFFAQFFLLWIIKLALAVALFVTHTKEVSVC